MTVKIQTRPHFSLPFLPDPWWWIAGGSLLFIAWLGMAALIAHLDAPGSEGRVLLLQFCMWAGLFWWLLMGTRFVALLYRMVPLRLPGLQPLLWQGWCLHGVLVIGLPLLVAGLWPAAINTDILALAAALWLGWACGALITSLPVFATPLPVGMLIGCAGTLTTPWIATTAGTIALLGTYGIWRWHLGGLRSPFAAPLGAWLEGASMQLQLIGYLQNAAVGTRSRYSPPFTQAAYPHTLTNARDLLAAWLGPGFQTLRQLWGYKGQGLAWLAFIGVAALLFAVEHFWLYEQKVASNFMLYFVICIFLPMERPQRELHAIHHSKPAQMAELFLTPGMPAREQLERTLLRQVALCLSERMLLLYIFALASLNLSYPINSTTLIWLACVALLSLGKGLYSAWLAWHGHKPHWLRLVWMAIFVGALIGTSNVLIVQQKPMVLALWLCWGAFILAVLVQLVRDWHSIYAPVNPYTQQHAHCQTK